MREFRSLDREAEIQISDRHLPHWFQPGVAVFVPFRTADSMPASVIIRWRDELAQWLKREGFPVELADCVNQRVRDVEYSQRLQALSLPKQREFLKLRNQLFHRSLDACHGECLLRDSAVRAFVADAIKYFDGERYELDCFVIMPNHVHCIVQFQPPYDLSMVSQSWMRFSARQINRLLGTGGAFWQAEPFDHLIRSEKQFLYLRKYIAENPVKAKLSADEYELYRYDA